MKWNPNIHPIALLNQHEPNLNPDLPGKLNQTLRNLQIKMIFSISGWRSIPTAPDPRCGKEDQGWSTRSRRRVSRQQHCCCVLSYVRTTESKTWTPAHDNRCGSAMSLTHFTSPPKTVVLYGTIPGNPPPPKEKRVHF